MLKVEAKTKQWHCHPGSPQAQLSKFQPSFCFKSSSMPSFCFQKFVLSILGLPKICWNTLDTISDKFFQLELDGQIYTNTVPRGFMHSCSAVDSVLRQLRFGRGRYWIGSLEVSALQVVSVFKSLLL